jgi:hypothetical protein
MRKMVSPHLKDRKNEKGLILIVVLFVSCCILMLSVPFLFKLGTIQRFQNRSFKSVQAMSLAEAGIDRTLWEINKFGGVGYTAWNQPTPGTFQLALNNFSTPYDNSKLGDIAVTVFPPTANTLTIESDGMADFISSNSVDRKVRVVLVKDYHSIFSYAIYAEWIYMASNAWTDSYNSNYGFYDDQTAQNDGNVATNNTAPDSIVLDSNARIHGSVAAGVGTPMDQLDVVINTAESNTFISGDKMVLIEPFDTNVDPHVSTFIAGLEWKPDLVLPNKGNVVLTESDSGIYDTISLSVNTVLTIQGDVVLYVTGAGGGTGSFSMKSNAEIVIMDENSSLKLIFGKATFHQASNTSVRNLSKIPSKCLIFGTTEFNSEVVGDLVWNSNSEFFGAFVVPHANLDYRSLHDLYGALVTKELDFNSNAAVHYDEALGELSAYKGGIPYWTVKSWHEVVGPPAVVANPGN